MNGCMLYFSGTGNSAYIAKLFCKIMAQYGNSFTATSIEIPRDYNALLAAQDIVGIVFPVYGSAPPRIVRELVEHHRALLLPKKLILLCTQSFFSGDGARSLTDWLPGADVLAAEHFQMPNNICNLPILPVPGYKTILRQRRNAIAKMERLCEDICIGRKHRRGFHPLSKAAGYWLQRSYFLPLEERANDKVYVDQEGCVGCKKCVRVCPVNNLEFTKELIHNGNCISCYRCVNLCPQKAIRVFLKFPVGRQYHGLYAAHGGHQLAH